MYVYRLWDIVTSEKKIVLSIPRDGEIISKVIEVCDAEARENKYKLNVQQGTKRVAFYTGVGITIEA